MSGTEVVRLLRFVVLNGIGTVLDVALVFLLHNVFGLWWVVTVFCGWLASTCTGFVLNHRFVFRDGQATVRQASFRYALLVAFNLAVGVVLVTVAVEHGWPYVPTRLLSSVFLVGVNFAVNRGWVFAVAPVVLADADR